MDISRQGYSVDFQYAFYRVLVGKLQQNLGTMNGVYKNTTNLTNYSYIDARIAIRGQIWLVGKYLHICVCVCV